MMTVGPMLRVTLAYTPVVFACSDYNTYSKSLFDKGERKVYTARSGAHDDLGDAEQQYKELKRTDKFRPEKDFQGVDRYADKTR